MKLIDVDSKATLEDFLTLRKKTELVQFLRKCNIKISGIKNEFTLRQRCRDVSFNTPFRWQWKKWAAIDSSLVFNFYKENYKHDILFFETSIKKVIYFKTYFSLDL